MTMPALIALTTPIPCTTGDLVTATDATEVPPDAFAALLAGVAAVPLTVLTPVPTEEPAPAAESGGVPAVAMPVLRPPALVRPSHADAATRAVPATPAQPGGAGQRAIPAIPAVPAVPAQHTAPTPPTPQPAPVDEVADPPVGVPVEVPGIEDAVLVPTTAVAPERIRHPHGRDHVHTDHRHLDVPAAAVAAPVPAPATTAEAVAVPPQAGPTEVGRTHHVRPALLEAAKHLKTEGGRTSLVIRLDPPELGAVLVRLTVKDGQVDVQLRTPDLAARSDLQAQQLDVQQVLREQGLDLSSFDVAHGDVLSQTPNDDRQTPDRGTPRRRSTADGAASTAHVMDDVARPQPAGTWL